MTDDTDQFSIKRYQNIVVNGLTWTQGASPKESMKLE